MRIQQVLVLLTCFFYSCQDNRYSILVTEEDELLFRKASENALLANKGFIKTRSYLMAWLEYSDPESALIPRNLEKDKDFWNAKDAAADNYPFMVLTSFFVDEEIFQTSMHEMLAAEKTLTSRVKSLPDTYSFSKQDFLNEEVNMADIVFGSSEYVKDGLLPLTEWLGPSPWSERMIEILSDLNDVVDVVMLSGKDGNRDIPDNEVNGELLQVLSRVYWMTGEEKFLDWAIQIGDYYLLADNHPTNDLEYLRLRDHGCELVSGLCELYLAVNYARPEKKQAYKVPIHQMLDRILDVGRNEDGFFYDGINPVSGEIVQHRVADTWGYTLNGYYAVYMVDGKQDYFDAILKLFSNLPKYRNFDWEHGSSDGYADAIESGLNLYNRIPDTTAANWIDSEIKVMWNKQQESGIIEGWHGDGNFARTTIMYNLWKSKGLYVKPWREDVLLGAEQKGDSLLVTINAGFSWEGRLYFDQKRYQRMKLPVDWPRINQFPEWYTVKPSEEYQLVNLNENTARSYSGSELMSGIELKIEKSAKLIIMP